MLYHKDKDFFFGFWNKLIQLGYTLGWENVYLYANKKIVYRVTICFENCLRIEFRWQAFGIVIIDLLS